MTHRLKTLTLALLLAATASASAQGLRLPASPASPAPVPATTSTPTKAQSDFIVAVVNSEPITNNQVRLEVARLLQQFALQNRPQPDVQTLAAEVFDGLINRRIQLQSAAESGLKADNAAIDEAEQTIALQNQFDVAELRRRVVREGQTLKQFRTELGDQIVLQRLREREVEARVRITDAEVAAYQSEQQQAAQDLSALQLNLAQILIAVPESASVAQVQALHTRALRVLERARAGDDFAALVREFSESSDVANGGQLGLRPASRYPELFVQATQRLGVGDVADVVRSPAGFHVLKVVEKVASDGAPTVTQSHARHILLLPGPALSEFEARQKLADFKKQVLAGKADFAELARQHSKDGSAAKGGDLGWASPGMFVPEFEEAMNRLAPGDISEPLVSRFGVHLIQVQERRKTSLTPEQQREAVRAMLRDKKAAEAYQTWAQELRGRAYIELREPPL